MISLSDLELNLLRCAATADKIRRPSAGDLKVGDEVIVSRAHTRRGDQPTTVTAVGRVWIAVSGCTYKFRRDTLRSTHGSGAEDVLKTVAQHAYDEQIRAARSRLLDGGVSANSAWGLSDGRILAFAALLDLMDEASGNEGS